MKFKLLKLLLFFYVLTASQAQASLLVFSHSNPPTGGAHRMMSHNSDIAQHQQHRVNGCCESEANASVSNQHCDGNTCQNGNCNYCSHCVTALTQIVPATTDPITSYHEDKITSFMTVYPIADPRPPRT